MEWLFVYGTLKNPEVQRQVFGRPIRGEADTLRGFLRTSFTFGGETYPAVVPHPSGSVQGLVLHLDPKDLEAADQHEGSQYRREQVILASGKQAWVYRKV